MNDGLMDFLEFVEIEEAEVNHNLNIRVPKRYVHDAENPMEMYHEHEFVKRYRYTLIFNERGLPIPLMLQLLRL
ncbi:hypothetical protein FQA39_LY16996 [Lamprigera yunnana]|nr:hypothetical protein FQA39_LY16996 [Lamprigera yunnana]